MVLTSSGVAPPEPTDRRAFAAALADRGLEPPVRGATSTLQLNLTRRCNLACHHCHVESGPRRTEALEGEGCERILELLEASPGTAILDLTGGAPELHPDFRFLVRGARALGRQVIDRCNLTVLFEPGQPETAEFLADQDVHIVASLPCYMQQNVEQQRGRGVFARSIDALRMLNRLGYGRGGDEAGRALRLDLVYNPLGAFLPPAQAELEQAYRKELSERFEVAFDSLLTIANMPIKRFARSLSREGQTGEYMRLLVDHFNPDTLPSLMCRNLVSVDHGGRLYDCDFNQALEIDLETGPRSIWDLRDLTSLEGRAIATAAHCFGCTAGAGSSCGGALA